MDTALLSKLSHHPDFIVWAKDNSKCSCGAEDALFDFIPDTIYGITIKASCCRHDHRYMIGGTQNDKDLADIEFLQNMLTQINEGIVWWKPTFLARRRAMTYYEAVVRCGESSFNFHE